MARNIIHDDIEFIKLEFRRLKAFLSKYFSEKSEDDNLDFVIDALEFGPFNAAKFFISVFIPIMFYFFAFQTWTTDTRLVVSIFMLVILYEILFEKEWLIPIITTIIGGIFSGISALFTGIFSGGSSKE